MNTLHDRLVLLADEHIKDYRDDLLVHDKTAIEANPNLPFLHFTGESGTHIVFLLEYQDYPKKGEKTPYLFSTVDRDSLLEEIKNMVFAMRRTTRQDLILYYDGQSVLHNLFDITQDIAEEIIATYHNKMSRLFNEEVKQA